MLGLGNIGALAGKPVMEGKAVLFKKLAGIDSIDIEITPTDVDEVVNVIAAMEPTFGGSTWKISKRRNVSRLSAN